MGQNKDIVVVGTSAGGLSALQTLVEGLPADFAGAMFVVLHLSPNAPSALARILQRQSAIPVAEAGDGEVVRPGRIYTAPPDYHLVLDGDTMRLTRGPRENRHRPAIDALFRSAAFAYDRRVVGVLLTGELDDGTAGLWEVKNRGGTAVVQDPADAWAPSMPRNALQYVRADHVLPMREIAAMVTKLTRASVTGEKPTLLPAEDEAEIETRVALEADALHAGVRELGPNSPYTCPECHGVLTRLKSGGVPRFRCHTGHAYSIYSLLAAVDEDVEHSMWNALRSIEESELLLAHLARHLAESKGDQATIERFQKKARDAQRLADLMRQATWQHQILTLDKVGAPAPDSLKAGRQNGGQRGHGGRTLNEKNRPPGRGRAKKRSHDDAGQKKDLQRGAEARRRR